MFDMHSHGDIIKPDKETDYQIIVDISNVLCY